MGNGMIEGGEGLLSGIKLPEKGGGLFKENQQYQASV